MILSEEIRCLSLVGVEELKVFDIILGQRDSFDLNNLTYLIPNMLEMLFFFLIILHGDIHNIIPWWKSDMISNC